jgi:hypothetical protein
VLDGVECAHALECLASQGGSLRFVPIVELAPDVRPTRGFPYLPRGVEWRVFGKGVGLQDPFKVFQVRLRVFSPPLERVGEPHRRGWWAFPQGRSSRT